MTISPAPLFEDVAGGPAGGTAHWVTTSDNIRIRVAAWAPKSDAKGAVLLFPGRTEYIEKYGSTAKEFVDRGYAVLAIDWRGQGLADRLLDDPRVGHVAHFTDFQKDVSAALRVARDIDLPKPWHVVGHSMGGAIALRSVIEGLSVQSCAFTGPMWGIYFNPVMKQLSRLTTYWGPKFGLGHKNPPTTSLESYVLSQEFEGNVLTRDPDMYKMMQAQLEAHPELSLGAPSTYWLGNALDECAHLATRPSPDLPCLTFLGTHEQIVDRDAVRARMQNWPRGRLVEIPGGEHEVLMEAAEVRNPVFDQLISLFAGNEPKAGSTTFQRSA